jgi:hypothetical protein
MSTTPDSAPTSSLVRTTLAAAASIGILSFAAATWLAGSDLDTRSLVRLAAARTEAADPVTTGSIGHHANAVLLDPCALPRR